MSIIFVYSQKEFINRILKESEAILKDAKIDADAKTRKQAKAISSLKASKKPKLSKKKTMLETAKVNRRVFKNSLFEFVLIVSFFIGKRIHSQRH